MSAILNFRRGISVPSLLSGEPFLNETDTVLVIGIPTGSIQLANIGTSNSGSFTITGDISASNALFNGTVTITDDIIIGGSIVLGDNPVDEIELNGVLSGSMIPSTGSVFNIGSSGNKWNTLYAENAVITNFTASAIDYTDIFNKPTLFSGSSQIDHNTTTNYTGSEHINHSTLGITAGDGLSGGGILTTTRTVNLDTASAHFTDGVSAIAQPTPAGTVSGSDQLTGSYDLRYDLSGSGGGLANIIEDTTPQLGGNLDINGNNISGSGNIDLGAGYYVSASGFYGPDGAFFGAGAYQPSGMNIGDGNFNIGIDTGVLGRRYQYLLVSDKLTIRSQDIAATNTSGVFTSLFQFSHEGILTLLSGSVSSSAYYVNGGIGENALLDDGTLISTASLGGAAPAGTVSGSDQVTSSLDTRYPVLNTDNIFTGTTNIFLNISASGDTNGATFRSTDAGGGIDWKHFASGDSYNFQSETSTGSEAFALRYTLNTSGIPALTTDLTDLGYINSIGIVSGSDQLTGSFVQLGSNSIEGVTFDITNSSGSGIGFDSINNTTSLTGGTGSGQTTLSIQNNTASLNNYSTAKINAVGITSLLTKGYSDDTYESIGTGIVSGSIQVDHDQTTDYTTSRHIDHDTTSISAGPGLSGGGFINTTRTISLNSGSDSFISGSVNAMNIQGVISGSDHKYLIPTASDATDIDMGYSGGHLLYMSAPSTATTFTTNNPRLNGWAKVRISGSADAPVVTGGTFISGAIWNSSISGSEQYLGIGYNGNIIEYFYLDI